LTRFARPAGSAKQRRRRYFGGITPARFTTEAAREGHRQAGGGVGRREEGRGGGDSGPGDKKKKKCRPRRKRLRVKRWAVGSIGKGGTGALSWQAVGFCRGGGIAYEKQHFCVWGSVPRQKKIPRGARGGGDAVEVRRSGPGLGERRTCRAFRAPNPARKRGGGTLPGVGPGAAGRAEDPGPGPPPRSRGQRSGPGEVRGPTGGAGNSACCGGRAGKGPGPGAPFSSSAAGRERAGGGTSEGGAAPGPAMFPGRERGFRGGRVLPKVGTCWTRGGAYTARRAAGPGPPPPRGNVPRRLLPLHTAPGNPADSPGGGGGVGRRWSLRFRPGGRGGGRIGRFGLGKRFERPGPDRAIAAGKGGGAPEKIEGTVGGAVLGGIPPVPGGHALKACPARTGGGNKSGCGNMWVRESRLIRLAFRLPQLRRSSR
jgi:hypothetical protein